MHQAELGVYSQKIYYAVFFLSKNRSESRGVLRCSVKKVFSEISQNSRENTCARVSFLTMLKA